MIFICVHEIAKKQRDSKVVRFWDEIIANERFICDDDFDGLPHGKTRPLV